MSPSPQLLNVEKVKTPNFSSPHEQLLCEVRHLCMTKWPTACVLLMETCNCRNHRLGSQHAAEEQIAVIPFSHQAVRHACLRYLEINISVHSA